MNFDAAVDHMNGDHRQDSMLICAALGGVKDISDAEVTLIDTLGVEFAMTTSAGVSSLRLEWTEPITERQQVRERIVELHSAAEAAAAQLDT